MLDVSIPFLGHSVRLVPRDQLRFTLHGRDFGIPRYLRGLVSTQAVKPFDWSKGRAVKYPLLGNDQKGDCFYAACCHASQTWTANSSSKECEFDEAQLLARYYDLSGGDKGLGDKQMLPEWKEGIIGPYGPRRILDEMTVDPHNLEACLAAGSNFGGLIYTCSLLFDWLKDPAPGDIWDTPHLWSLPNPLAGHAMHLSGWDGEYWQDETWGFDPAIRLTYRGLLASDPELIVAFSLDQFTTGGVCAFTGMSYEEKADLWLKCGGIKLPRSPFV